MRFTRLRTLCAVLLFTWFAPCTYAESFVDTGKNKSSIAEITEVLSQKLANTQPFGKKIKLSLDGNIILLDGKANPPIISHDDFDVDATVTCSLEDFVKILNKELNPQMALLSGRLKMKGDVMAAMSLTRLL